MAEKAWNQTCEQAFWRDVSPEPNTGCWLWAGIVYPKGYGRLSAEGRRHRAHRVAYSLFRGDPGPMHVLHRCDTPSCVNPSHLFLGTNLDNVRDRQAKGRPCTRRGEGNPAARFTEEGVREMVALRLSGWTTRALGRRFGVSHTAVRLILKGENWAHIHAI